MSAARIFTLSRHSVRADVRGKKLNLLRSTFRATQLVRKVFLECAVIWAELFNHGINIKLLTVVALVAIRGKHKPVPFAVAQRLVCAGYPHDSLQGWLSYTVNNQRTNHIFQEVRK
uniref:hypothetical protein n=1 Tax=Brucella pseudintermedia TaxID=370111 RepID=UPI0015894EA5|nr:hypothetical protein [Brucella pseudintermedia]